MHVGQTLTDWAVSSNPGLSLFLNQIFAACYEILTNLPTSSVCGLSINDFQPQLPLGITWDNVNTPVSTVFLRGSGFLAVGSGVFTTTTAPADCSFHREESASLPGVCLHTQNELIKDRFWCSRWRREPGFCSSDHVPDGVDAAALKT